MMAKTQETVRL